MEKAAKRFKSKKKEVKAAFQQEQMDALFAIIGHSEPDWEAEAKWVEQENSLLKATNDRLKTENDKHNKRVEMLEKALCSKIFKTENRMLSQEHQPGSCTTVVEKCSIHKKPPQVQVFPEGAERVSPAAPTLEQSSPTRPLSAAEAEVSWEGADNETVEAAKLYSPTGNEDKNGGQATFGYNKI
ncbi:uncharacterized protein [Dermacentor andersoni]|uniref:uncharacterized protein isoform X2 n=1 Tax=Dermacentor andersoni TaxID=34620 RepID=UPI0024180FAF|nr:uncharacterized protein LOC126526159 isoform X2 [Dermacentor andersoni]